MLFFVTIPRDYKHFASYLSYLDHKCYYKDEFSLVTNVYEWLRDVGQKNQMFNPQPTAKIKESMEILKVC